MHIAFLFSFHFHFNPQYIFLLEFLINVAYHIPSCWYLAQSCSSINNLLRCYYQIFSTWTAKLKANRKPARKLWARDERQTFCLNPYKIFWHIRNCLMITKAWNLKWQRASLLSWFLSKIFWHLLVIENRRVPKNALHDAVMSPARSVRV